MAREVIIYADESDQKGPHFGNFYGGALVRSDDLSTVIASLDDVKAQHNLLGEIKWSKVSGPYLEKYIACMDRLFALVAEDRVKIRIMFTSRQDIPVGLSSDQQDRQYHLLYYQFVKHAFGLQFAESGADGLRVRCYFDRMPDTNERNRIFKRHIASLGSVRELRANRVRFPMNQIAEVRSHDHVVLQMLDVVLGAMQFRLNDKHLAKPPGATRRGKKTIAKERLYKHINRRIRELYPGFNVGISTGTEGARENRWRHPYRHWKFVPARSRRDPFRGKRT